MGAGTIPPTGQERTVLLSSVLVQSRPLHLAFSLAYMEHFAFSVPPELEASLAILVQAVKMVETMVERRSHSARRREVSLEQLIGLTEELENRYGRHGEPETDRPRSTRDLEREWRSLDSSNPTQGWPPPRQGNLLKRFHSRILCSGD